MSLQRWQIKDKSDVKYKHKKFLQRFVYRFKIWTQSVQNFVILKQTLIDIAFSGMTKSSKIGPNQIFPDWTHESANSWIHFENTFAVLMALNLESVVWCQNTSEAGNRAIADFSSSSVYLRIHFKYIKYY